MHVGAAPAIELPTGASPQPYNSCDSNSLMSVEHWLSRRRPRVRVPSTPPTPCNLRTSILQVRVRNAGVKAGVLTFTWADLQNHSEHRNSPSATRPSNVDLRDFVAVGVAPGVAPDRFVVAVTTSVRSSALSHIVRTSLHRGRVRIPNPYLKFVLSERCPSGLFRSEGARS